MDYFLLLCSLLLPVVSTVEGKISPFQPLFAMPGVFSPRHVSPLPGRSWVPQGVSLPITQVTSFFFCHPRLKFPLFFLNKVAIWIPLMER